MGYGGCKPRIKGIDKGGGVGLGGQGGCELKLL